MALRPVCIARLFVGSGRSSRGGRFRGFDTAIDPQAHRAAVERVIREEFPRGSTHVKARGTWRGAGGRVISEPSIVVEIWSPGTPAACAAHFRKIEAAAARLRALFGQESVAVLATDPGGRNLVDFVARAPRRSRFVARRSRSGT